MRSTNVRKSALFFIALIFSQMASAVTPAEEEEKKCMKPKFRDFSPAANAEVAPKSSISFHINRLADPNHISASAKKIPMKIEVVDKKTFYYVTGKLPDELTEGFARIHVQAKALEGECIGQDGWLVKIKGDAGTAASNEQTQDKPGVSSSSVAKTAQ